MSDENEEFEQWISSLYSAAHAWMEEGYTAHQVKGFLMEKGLEEELALTVVSDLSTIRHAARRKAGEKNMMVGGLWLTIGIVVTIATHAAAEGGGTYLVAWGAILFGAIQFFRGLAQSTTSPDESIRDSASSTT